VVSRVSHERPRLTRYVRADKTGCGFFIGHSVKVFVPNLFNLAPKVFTIQFAKQVSEPGYFNHIQERLQAETKFCYRVSNLW
jgi:hypothetical protein